MKAKSPRNTRPIALHHASLTLKVSERVFQILNDIQKRFMPGNNNSADAAWAVLTTALIDYDHLMARCLQIENYCKAEGIAQDAYRERILRAKFPRGRVPRQKSER